jgi:hypothetical protein
VSIVDDTLRQFAGIELQEVRGSAFGGEIPLTAALVNRLLARRLARWGGPIAAVLVEPHDGQRFTANLELRGQPFLKEARIEVQIEKQPELPDHPMFLLRWSMPGLGALARMAAPLVSQFKQLPPGIRMDSDHVLIDLRVLLDSLGYGELLPHLTGLHVQTREGAFVVRFDVRA